jgi:hypothetical protein
MKITYSKPTLTTYGTVETITQLYGAKTRKDFIFFSGNPNVANPGEPADIGTQGSIDGIVAPKS